MATCNAPTANVPCTVLMLHHTASPPCPVRYTSDCGHCQLQPQQQQQHLLLRNTYPYKSILICIILRFSLFSLLHTPSSRLLSPPSLVSASSAHALLCTTHSAFFGIHFYAFAYAPSPALSSSPSRYIFIATVFGFLLPPRVSSSSYPRCLAGLFSRLATARSGFSAMPSSRSSSMGQVIEYLPGRDIIFFSPSRSLGPGYN